MDYNRPVAQEIMLQKPKRLRQKINDPLEATLITNLVPYQDVFTTAYSIENHTAFALLVTYWSTESQHVYLIQCSSYRSFLRELYAVKSSTSQPDQQSTAILPPSQLLAAPEKAHAKHPAPRLK